MFRSLPAAFLRLGFLIVLIATTVSMVRGQAPSTINHQGYLEDADGVPLDGNFILTFSLYDAATDGTELWSEDQGVEIANGLFHTILGTSEPLDGLAFDSPYWLGLSVNSGSELEPRLPLSAVPYSLSAKSVPDSSLTPSKFSASSGSEGQVLTIEGDSVVWKDVAIPSETGVEGINSSELLASDNFLVLVNRENRIGAEWFGVRAPVAGENQYGGMYMETNGEGINNARPFYGYAHNGSATGWHELDGESGEWRLTIGSATRLRVNSDGDASITGGLTADGLIESLADGVKFPDGTIQTTAASSEPPEIPAINFVDRGDDQFLVLVNRDNRIGAEWFGVRAPVTGENQWGGMYMETNGDGIENSKPFYGYAHNGDVTAWHELDGQTNEWRLVIGGPTRFKVDGNNGNVFADGTFNPGGADLAESFDVEGSTTAYEPGDVLTISERADRTVARSSSAYSTLVAGVYASKPGVLLSENGISGTNGDQIPMGVVGVVPTKVTLEGGAIQRGDLLVTSSTPGHAMKADPGRTGFGMVLGKALEPLQTGESGIIDVLVTVR